MFKQNYKGVSERMEFTPIPEGDYSFEIVKADEKKSHAGDPLVNVTAKVAEGQFMGRLVFHNVTFLPREHQAAGMSKRFLHAIGCPYEGDEVEVDPATWPKSMFKAHVKIVEYKGKPKNEIDEVYAPEEKEESEVPF